MPRDATPSSPPAQPNLPALSRCAFSNNARLNAPANRLASNKVSTAKYTLWNFLPKNLFEQFRRLANVYFLLVGLIQATTNLSPTGRWNTLGPLLVVMFVNGVREVLEDLARHAQDRKDNARQTHVRSESGELVPTPWARVRVGDIIAVEEGEEFPADCILLTAEAATGRKDRADRAGGAAAGGGGDDEGGGAEVSYCFVETANLDGESTLKLRSAALITDDSVAAAAAAAAAATAAAACSGADAAVAPPPVLTRQLRRAELSSVRVRVDYEAPSSALYTFAGSIAPCDEHGELSPGVPRQLLNLQQLLLRGTTLRNSRRAHALVVYTGADMRSVRNSLATPSKRSNVEERIDRSVLLIFVCLLALCGVSWVLAYMSAVLDSGHWYLHDDGAGAEAQTPAYSLLVSFLILYNNLVPISLYVTVEAIKLAMSHFVQSDLGMFSEEHGAPASSRTSNLHEDLGQIEYVFTDKTGTLTMNQMVFARCSIDGLVYGSSSSADKFGAGAAAAAAAVASREGPSAAALALHTANSSLELPSSSFTLPNSSSNTPSSSPQHAHPSAAAAAAAAHGASAAEAVRAVGVHGGAVAHMPRRSSPLSPVQRVHCSPLASSRPACAGPQQQPAGGGTAGAAAAAVAVSAQDGMGVAAGGESARLLELPAGASGAQQQAIPREMNRSQRLSIGSWSSQYRFDPTDRHSRLASPAGTVVAGGRAFGGGANGLGGGGGAWNDAGAPSRAHAYGLPAQGARTPFESAAAPFDPTELCDDYCRGGQRALRIGEFMLCASTCHSMLPGKTDGADEAMAAARGARASMRSLGSALSASELWGAELSFKTASPDEGALLAGAARAGWLCVERTLETVTVRVHGREQRYALLATNEFSPSRKRMSVLLRRLPDEGGGEEAGAEADAEDEPGAAVAAGREGGGGRRGSHASGGCRGSGSSGGRRGSDDSAQLSSNGGRRASDDSAQLSISGGRRASGDSGLAAVGEYIVCCKGADDVMLELVCPPQEADEPAQPQRPHAEQHAGSDDESAARAAAPGVTDDEVGACGACGFGSAGGRAGGGAGGGAGGEARARTPPDVRAGCADATRLLSPPAQAAGSSRAHLARANTLEHLRAFATAGLRTLVLAVKHIDAPAAEAWLAEHRAAAAALERRDELLEQAAARLEVGMRLAGVSAIEDRLQPGVPHAIQALRSAGMHVWMLTGDKMETAINIATAARLLSAEHQLLILAAPEKLPPDSSAAAAEGKPRRRGGSRADAPAEGRQRRSHAAARIKARLHELEDELRGLRWCSAGSALVIDSRSLSVIFGSEQMERQLVDMSRRCAAVIVCRVSPLHKALAIRLVKAHVSPTPLTLAIGDGANDVSMIQEADIGVGIHGVEGTQARRASDYSLAQFRFLARLLLVHGRHNYRRVCLAVLYSFYKNVTMVLTLFLFGLDSSFSAASLYDGWLMAVYNVFFTFAPVIAHGVCEQDVSPPLLLAFPQLYGAERAGSELNAAVVLLWLLTALLHAFVIYAGGSLLLGASAHDPLALGGHVRGTAINGLLVATVSLKLAMHTTHWTAINVVLALTSALLWFAFTAAYSLGGPSLGLWEFADVGTRLLGLPSFWLALLLVPTAALGVDFAVAAASAAFWPSPRQVLMELDRGAAQQHAQHATAAGEGGSGVGFRGSHLMGSVPLSRRASRVSETVPLHSRSGSLTVAHCASAASHVALLGGWDSGGVSHAPLAMGSVAVAAVGDGGGGGTPTRNPRRRMSGCRNPLAIQAMGSRGSLGLAISRSVSLDSDAAHGGAVGGGGCSGALLAQDALGLPGAGGGLDPAPGALASLSALAALGALGAAGEASDEASLERMESLELALAASAAAVVSRSAPADDDAAANGAGSKLAQLVQRRAQAAFEDSIEAILRDQAKRAPGAGATLALGGKGGAGEPPARARRAEHHWVLSLLAYLRAALDWLRASTARAELRGAAAGDGGRGDPRCHPLWLTFESARLERLYMAAFSARNLRLSVFVVLATMAVLAIHLCVALGSVLRGEEASLVAATASAAAALSGTPPSAHTALRGERSEGFTAAASAVSICGFALYLGALLGSPLTRRHIEGLNVSVFALAGFGALFAVRDARALVMLVFPVLLHVAIPARWHLLWPVTLLHHVAFVAIEYANFGRVDGLLSFFWVLTFLSTNVVSRSVEQRERRDFALQQRVLATKAHNDSILDNMLPAHVNAQRRLIAERGGKVIASDEPSVSVLFCDIQDFKQIVKENSPAQLISLLDSLYSAMDAVCEAAGVTKMETVGYTYMAAAGLQGAPQGRAGHAYDAVAMALELLRLVDSFQARNGRQIVVRIGINSGAVLAGVVGKSKPQYCLFGDTVNTAARMQATGVRGRLQISSSTHALLMQEPALAAACFDLEARQVHPKGKPVMDTFLLSLKPGTALPPLHADLSGRASSGGALGARYDDDDAHASLSPGYLPAIRRGGRGGGGGLGAGRSVGALLRRLSRWTQLPTDQPPEPPALSSDELLGATGCSSTRALPIEAATRHRASSAGSAGDAAGAGGAGDAQGGIALQELRGAPQLACLQGISSSSLFFGASESTAEPRDSPARPGPRRVGMGAGIEAGGPSAAVAVGALALGSCGSSASSLGLRRTTFGALFASPDGDALSPTSASAGSGEHARHSQQQARAEEAAQAEEAEVEAQINRCDLSFSAGSEESAKLERIFTRAHDVLALAESRRTLLIFACGQLGYMVMEGVIFLQAEPARQSSAYVAMASALVLLAVCAATTVLGPVASALRMTAAELFAVRWIRLAVVLGYTVYGMLIPVAQVAKRDSFGSSSSALLIFSAALLSSAGGARFFEVLLIATVWFVTWVACGAGLGGFRTGGQQQPGGEGQYLPEGETASAAAVGGRAREHAVGRLLRELLLVAEDAFAAAARPLSAYGGALGARRGRRLLQAAADAGDLGGGIGDGVGGAEQLADELADADDRQPGLHTLIVIILCALLASVYAAYTAERSKRRLYLLLFKHHKEMSRTDELLTDMMPPSVVAKLKEGVQVADEFHDVLLLYSDIKGFTQMAAECTPAQVIRALEELYTVFDTLVLQHDLFKVQTIGDAYIIMSNEHSDKGSGRRRTAKESRHARQQKAQRDCEAMLRMAFDMISELAEFKAPHGKPLQMRIGIHYGTVTAGVIGRKKLRYDIFGTDALLGNALESEGVPGGVCVSDRVLPLMSHLPQYACTPHGEVVLKEGNELIGKLHAFEVRDLVREAKLQARAEAAAAAAAAAEAAHGSPSRVPTGLHASGSFTQGSHDSPVPAGRSMLRSLSSVSLRRRTDSGSPCGGRFANVVSAATRSLISPSRSDANLGAGEHDVVELEPVGPREVPPPRARPRSLLSQ